MPQLCARSSSRPQRIAGVKDATQPAALATRRILVSAEVTQDGLNTSLQNGLDIVERERAGSHCLYQVKRYKELTDRKITRALGHGVRPSEVNTDRAPAYPRVLEELLPSACHVVEQYENNPIESDHGRLKSRLRVGV